MTLVVAIGCMTPKLITVLLLTLLVYGNMRAQTHRTIDTLENRYNDCLNKGRNSLGCAKKFYYQIDSMVHLAYLAIYAKLDTAEKKDFKEEQIDWLTKRDKHFKSTYIKFKQNNPFLEPYGLAKGAQYDAQIMFDKNARYVRDRTVKLLRRLEKMERKRKKQE